MSQIPTFDGVGARAGKGLRPLAGVLRFSSAHFLGALILMLVMFPLMEASPYGEAIEAVTLTLVLLSAVLAVGGRRGSLAIAIFLVVPALATKWLDHLWPELVPPKYFLVCTLVFMGYIVARLLAFVVRAPKADSEVLSAAVGTYLLMGLLWGVVYSLVARLDPSQFVFTVNAESSHMRGFTALYFSFVTLSTVGYGDIVPAGNAARMLAMVEAMAGLFYMTVLVARLVSLYATKVENTEAGK